MNAPDPIEGFWTHPDFTSPVYHYFIHDGTESICGKWRLREMSDTRQDRRPGKDDCLKCVDIYRELNAPKIPSDPEEDWSVKTDPIQKTHTLYYQGKPQSTVRGEAGLATQNELAVIFNRNGTLPKTKGKIKCAADAPNAARFLEKKSKHSPELPLVHTRNFKHQDLEELITYLESLFDESAIGSVRKPVYFDQVSKHLDTENEETIKILRWLWLTRADEIPMLCEWLAWRANEERKPEAAEPPNKESFQDLEFNIACQLKTQDLLKLVRFIFQITPPTPQTKAMPATRKAPAEIAAPVVEIFPASHFRRYPANRSIREEAIKNMEASERESGILDPLLVRAIPGETELEIINGETRWLGAKRIDPEYPIPCFVRTLTDKEAAALHGISNFQRTDLTPFEEGAEVKHMLDCGWEMKEISEHLGKGENWLYKRLSLLKMPEEGKTAFLEGNLSLNTAMKILSLPEEKQIEAVKAVSEPTRAASALPEREALDFIEQEFVKPLQKATEWEDRRDFLEKENPGCQWLKYEHAIKAGDHNSGYVRADYEPSNDLLSDAAKLEELVVPTWKELATKHGSTIYIGLYRYQPKEAYLYVIPDAIIEAEKAVHNENPGDCIFSHEKAVQKNRDDAARRKLEEEQRKEALKLHQAALKIERAKFADMVLAPDGIGKGATKKLIEATFDEVNENGDDDSHLADALGIDTEAEYDVWSQKTKEATLKYLRSKSFSPFEAMGRLKLASFISDSYSFITEVMFNSGAAKPADFPAFHADYLKRLEMIKQQQADAEREPESNSGEDAA